MAMKGYRGKRTGARQAAPAKPQAYTWTKEECDGYSPRIYAPLQRLYKERGLLHPEERAKFLAEEALPLLMIDQEVLMYKAKSEGRAAALNLLEDMIISLHQAHVERHRQEIILPLLKQK